MDTTSSVNAMVIGFEGNHFSGEILPALEDVVQRGLVRILDLAFVRKDVDGKVTVIRLEDAGPDMGRLVSTGIVDANDIGGLISEEDVADMADSVEPGSSAAMMVFEQTWLNRVREAIANANGKVMTFERVPIEVVEQVRKSRSAG
jgi:uncharacterized membrane protein